jgi:hypothetical protein
MSWGVALNKTAYPYMLIVNQRILIHDNKKIKIFTTKDKLEILSFTILFLFSIFDIVHILDFWHYYSNPML